MEPGTQLQEAGYLEEETEWEGPETPPQEGQGEGQGQTGFGRLEIRQWQVPGRAGEIEERIEDYSNNLRQPKRLERNPLKKKTRRKGH